MKIRSMAVSAFLMATLTACGGSGGSSSNSSSSSNQSPNSNSVQDPTSQAYSDSLKAFATVWVGSNLLGSLNDFIIFAGNTGACGGSGTLSYAAPVQTLTNCVRTYPSANAYLGTYSGTGTPVTGGKTVSVNTINGVSVLTPSNLSSVQFKISSGSFAGSDVSTNSNDTTTLTSGSVMFSVGASSSYQVKNLSTNTLNTGTSLQSTGSFSVVLGAAQYDVTITQPIVSTTSYPTSGTASAAYSSTTCTPLVINFTSSSAFSLSCGGHTQAHNWTDSDVVAAIAAAKL